MMVTSALRALTTGRIVPMMWITGLVAERASPDSKESEVALEEVQTWVEKMGERGKYSANSARMRVTSLDQLTTVLGADEANDPASVLAAIDDIGHRWALVNNANPETTRSYVSRARTTLADYLQYQQDPTSFKGRSRGTSNAPNNGTKPKTDRTTRAAKPPTPTLTVSVPSPSAFSGSPTTGKTSHVRSFPLQNAREFVFILPTDGLDADDVVRIASHLMTLAKNVDPWDPPYRIVKNAADKS